LPDKLSLTLIIAIYSKRIDTPDTVTISQDEISTLIDAISDSVTSSVTEVVSSSDGDYIDNDTVPVVVADMSDGMYMAKTFL